MAKKQIRPPRRPAPPPRNPFRWESLRSDPRVAGGLLLLLAVLVYLPVWRAGFIWDDDDHLTRNPCIVGPLGFADIWTSSQAVYYPLVLTTFWILHKFVGLNPLPFHVLNVIMHGLAGILLWRVLRRLGAPAAWLGAALWVLHPVMVQSVAWVTELKNTQSAVLYLASALFFLRAEDEKECSRRSRWRIVSIGLFALAITSKSSTVMLPVLLFLAVWWRSGSISVRKAAELLPYLVISAVAAAWTIWEQKFHSGAIGERWSQSLAARVSVAGRDVWFYLTKLAWPVPLSFFYPRWKIEGLNLVSFLPFIGAVAAGTVLFWKRNSGPSWRAVFFAAACFVISIFPVLDFFDVYYFRYSFVSDHFQYLAAMAPLALVGSALGSLVRSARLTPLAGRVAAGVILVALATLTWTQAANYSDIEKLYRMSIERNPESWPAYSNLGALALQKRNFQDAITYCGKAVAINPGASEAQFNLGNAYLGQRQYGQAIPAYRAALETKPKNPQARANLAVSLLGVGRNQDAIHEFEESLRLDPNSAEVHYNLGYVLSQVARQEEGATHLRAALRLRPDYAAARARLREIGEQAPSP